LHNNCTKNNEFIDYFENTNNFMLIREAHKNLKVIATSKVERLKEEIDKELNLLKDIKLTVKDLKQRLSSYHPDDVLAKYFLFETESIPMPSNEIRKYVLESFDENRNIIEATSEFMERIFNDFKFVSGFSDITTPIEVIFKEKKGVCQK
jgi:ssDNA-specific exonuclease RecJ